MTLLQTCELLSICLEQMPIAVAMCDRNLNYLFASQRWLKMFNLLEKEVIGRSQSDLFGDLSPQWQEKAQLCLEGYIEECEVKTPILGKEKPISVQWKMSPWRDANHQIGGILLLATLLPTEETVAKSATFTQPNDTATPPEMKITKEAETGEIEKAQQLEKLVEQLQKTQMQLVQSEKMSSLGQLVAGIAHEINNPVNFIYGNLTHATEYTQDILGLLELYADEYPDPTPTVQDEIEAIELDFLVDDLPKLLESMKVGAERIYEIVRSLRNFSRLDEAHMKPVDIHDGIESTLLILQNRLKAKPEHPAIEIVKNYGQLPEVECYQGQLNQVFMNLLANAIDALDEKQEKLSKEELANDPSSISISTSVIDNNCVRIAIADNGPGIEKCDVTQLFDPFFTTKPVGKGTGLGLAISYQIVVEKHQGLLDCNSMPGKGTEFIIELPIKQNP